MAVVRSLVLSLGTVAALAQDSNPLGKALQLLDDLHGKVKADGEAEDKAFRKYAEWCDDTLKDSKNTHDRAASSIAGLEASIGELDAQIQVHTSNVGELASKLAAAQKDADDAQVVRKKESSVFVKSEGELVEAVSTLQRAEGILAKEADKNPSFAQVGSKNAKDAIAAVSAVLDAAAFQTSDQERLQALLQGKEESSFDEPTAATYGSHSSNIVDAVADLREKAETQLSALRKAEVNGRHNYEMVAQSLKDEISADSKDKTGKQASLAEAQEGKATSEGEHQVAVKELAAAKAELASTRSSCIQVAQDHQNTVESRKEEIAAIEQAQQVLTETSSGAVSQSYSFVQVASSRVDGVENARSNVVSAVRKLAQKHHSQALAQLASRIQAVVRYGADPFAKVKGLIQDMIAKLETNAGAEATEKAYCDEQTSKTEAKKEELEAEVAKMTSKIDRKSAKTASLKADAKVLQSELAALAKEQAQMDQIRQETHADYVNSKQDLTLGLSGVRKAISVLREYYGGESSALLQSGVVSAMEQPEMPELHKKAGGAGSSIIGILEVVEADFAKNLATEETGESDAQATYEKVTQENKVLRAQKEQDVKYKTANSKTLDKEVSDISSDRSTSNLELSAVLEYYAKIKERCIAKPESFEDRQRRRAEEIAGLKEALKTLQEETAFIQRRTNRVHMRGTAAARGVLSATA